MAARLEWKGDVLCIGGFMLAQLYGPSERVPTWDYAVNHFDTGAPSQQYENRSDCRQDCESEVRRLLKEAGCEVEP